MLFYPLLLDYIPVYYGPRLTDLHIVRFLWPKKTPIQIAWVSNYLNHWTTVVSVRTCKEPNNANIVRVSDDVSDFTNHKSHSDQHGGQKYACNPWNNKIKIKMHTKSKIEQW